MIKKILLFGILFLFIFGFVKADYDNYSKFYISNVGLYGSSSPIDSNYLITPLKGGAYLTNYLGIGKSVLALNNQRFFWWTSNGYPYVYLAGGHGTVEGFFDRYYSCDYISGYDLTGCSVSYIDYSSGSTFDFDKQVFKSFFSNVKNGDGVFVKSSDWRYIGATYDFFLNYIQVCWNSDEFGKSLCFIGGECTDTSICNRNYVGYLVNSQNLGSQFNNGLTFGLLNNSWLGYAPGQNGYDGQFSGNIDGSSNVSENVNMTGNLLYNTCTNGYIYNKIHDIYGDNIDNVCYAGTYNTGLVDNNFNGSSYIYQYGLNYKELYTLTKGDLSRNNWFKSNESDMIGYKEGRFAGNPFLSQPVALYTYFENLYNGGFLGFDSAVDYGPYMYLNYCNLALFSNYNEEYKGQYFKDYCKDLAFSTSNGYYNTGSVGNIDDSEILPPGFSDGGNHNVSDSGYSVSVDWSGTLSGNTNNNFDGKSFINSFYQKLQSVYIKPNNNFVGFIPRYILIFMFALILFRFLSH